MSDNKSTSSVNIDFPWLLAIVFITLKLCGVITWSWWWVTCPLWGPFVLVVAVLATVAVIGLICALFSK